MVWLIFKNYSKPNMMKYSYTMIAILLATFSMAQESIEVRKGHLVIDKSSYAAYMVTIFETDDNFVEREWKSQMKDISEKVTTKKEWFIDNARIMSISQDTIDIYSKVIELKNSNNVDLIVAFNVDGTFVGEEDKKRHAAAEKYVYDFAFRTTKMVVNEQVETAEKALERSQKDFEILVKDKQRQETSIERNEEKTEKAEKKIESNGTDLKKLNSDIEVKQSMVGSGNDEKNAKELQRLLSQRSNLERDTDKQNSTIRSSKKKIEDAEYNLKKNATNQEEKKVEIEELTSALDTARTKLMNIK